jgi:hypothetical protein
LIATAEAAKTNFFRVNEGLARRRVSFAPAAMALRRTHLAILARKAVRRAKWRAGGAQRDRAHCAPRRRRAARGALRPSAMSGFNQTLSGLLRRNCIMIT